MSTVSNKKHLEDEAQDKIENIDFKMVTFSLAGKDYGIDIMKVKEIAKDSEFTYVPNTASYVRGVYNLRGDIISIIDLRLMFNLPAEKKAGLENMIILRLDDHIIGVIVDSTDKVIGINSETIQPTHPLFGDINVKYISGVVENEERLYIILDVERIFGKEEPMEMIEEETEDSILAAPAEVSPEYPVQPAQELDLTFISETLATFRKFYVSYINADWVHDRYAEWEQLRKLEDHDTQLASPEDADRFLETFYSRQSGSLFKEEYIKGILTLLPELDGNTVTAWNPGCGKGSETYSLACTLRMRFPDKKIKIWAHDNDLLSVSSASGIIFHENEIPEILKRFTQETKNGIQFIPDIKESILFEYHDIANENSFPPVDVIFARDLLSFLNRDDLENVLRDFREKLKPGGTVIIGDNEMLDLNEWKSFEQNQMVAFQKE